MWDRENMRYHIGVIPLQPVIYECSTPTTDNQAASILTDITTNSATIIPLMFG